MTTDNTPKRGRGRPRKYSPETPPPPKPRADPAHVSAVRREAALKSAAARRERSINEGIHPKSLHVRAKTYDKLYATATRTRQTITDLATETVEYGLAHLYPDD